MTPRQAKQRRRLFLRRQKDAAGANGRAAYLMMNCRELRDGTRRSKLGCIRRLRRCLIDFHAMIRRAEGRA